MFLFTIANFFMGYYKIKVEKPFVAKMMNLLLKYNLMYWKLKKNEKGDLTFFIVRKEYKMLYTFAQTTDCPIQVLVAKGFPFLWMRYKHRIGIPIGFGLFCFILWGSTYFIWEIRVTGNDKIRAETIIEELNEMGCGIGSFIPAIPMDALCNNFLLQSEEIAWISVNMRGTIANVEVKERILPPDRIDPSKPSNLIAQVDGQIESLSVRSGEPVVAIGDSVKKGELLVSGLIDSKRVGYRLRRSVGEVYAKVTKQISVTVPLHTQRKVFTGSTKTRKILNIFGKKINLFKNSGISIMNYDRIVSKERIIFFDQIEIPVSLTIETYNEYTYVPMRLTEAEAIRIANMEFTKKMTKELYQTDVLERYTTAEFTEDAYVINCEVYCVTNIAVESEILTEMENN